ncbi:sucrose-6-phosphate hydrolase [Lachnospiraceae bacterium KM106-2]|nr:sucrose-6-phosphate hydrolase [Lachnospiraceae bacterium KM106-2]
MTNSIQTASEDAYRLQFHLMPPKGWLNDPNGLCQMNGRYHVYFQYAPTSADGSGDKCWGHYESEDLIHWVYTGIAIYPDKLNHKLDASGAYSGSALVENGVMYLYYTGNVKLPGDYDYTTSGRLSNTILITSEDGIHLSEKECVVDNKDYPEHYSCHIRDPKVWKYKESYYMVLGARTRKDTGAVILYVSKDKKNWELLKEISTKEKFGYMWECPDIFEVDGTCLLSISPQGLKREEYKNQNIYQSGYFKLPYTMDEIVDPNCEITDLGDFMEWDMGFDFMHLRHSKMKREDDY